MKTILIISLYLMRGVWTDAQVHRTGQACTHYHAASDVNSGTFADARIAQSNVTQYQSAIQIAESQVINLVGDLAAKQAANANLTTIAGLSPINDDVLQRKAGAWTNRTPAQLKTDLVLTSTDVGLANVNNTSDVNKPVSTATQTALNLKADLASPTFTGTVTIPTPAFADNSTKAASTAYVTASNPIYARVTGSNVTTTGQTLVNVTGLSVALVANAVYEFTAVLSTSTTAVTTGTAYGVQYSAASATIEAQINGALTSTATKTERINAFNTATSAFLTTSAQTGALTIFGIVATGANAGNLTIQHLKLTSGTSTVFINSFLKVIRIQ
jgi:hypothetical protein